MNASPCSTHMCGKNWCGAQQRSDTTAANNDDEDDVDDGDESKNDNTA